MEVYKEFWKLEEILSLLERIWNEAWSDRNIDLRKKNKVCMKKFSEELKTKYSKFSYVFSLKLLKFLKENLNEINNFSKNKLKKLVRSKEYYPKLSDELINELHKEFLRMASFNFNIFSQCYSIRRDIFLKMNFILKNNLLTADDEEFYVSDNPICKEKVFKIPMIRASSWKGALRYAAMKCVLESNDNEKIKKRKIMLRLFGTEKDNIEKYLDRKFKEANILEKWKKEIEELKKKLKVKELHLRGRLIFFPTFFDQIDLDVIAPHDRRTRTVTERGPILFEVVPEGTNGTFSLLYYPFGLIEKLNSENEGEMRDALKEIKKDFEFLGKIIPEMLETYGFGAKTSSGYGIAKINKICVNDQDCGIDWKKVLEVVENEYGRR